MQHRPRKRFGQNFLNDTSVVEHIISAVNPQSDEYLIEIGPGKGVLTTPLLEAVGKLDVIEFDRDLIPILKNKCSQLGDLTIYNTDILDFDLSNLNKPGNLRIVGNLPYNISTPLLFHLIHQANYIQDMHFMLQKEVAERIDANPGEKDYGRLSVMVQYYCQTELLFTVDSIAFSPRPKVQSAFIRLTPHKEPPVRISNESIFEQIVKQAFSQRRKILRNNFKVTLNSEDFENIGIDPGLRAEALNLEQFAKLSNRITEKNNLIS